MTILIYLDLKLSKLRISMQPSQSKLIQSQQNNVRTTFSERCSSVIFLTLNRFLSAGS